MQNKIIVLQKNQLEKIIYNTVSNVLHDFKKAEKVKEKMSIKEAAKYLCISPVTLNRKKDKGIIPFSKLGSGGRIVFAKEDLDLYLENNKSTATHKST